MFDFTRHMDHPTTFWLILDLFLLVILLKVAWMLMWWVWNEEI